MIRPIALLLLVVPACSAQSALVANAVGSVSSHINTITPGMLATLSQSGLAVAFNQIAVLGAVPAPEPTAPISNILIRPAGSATTLPVNILSTALGTATFIVPAGVPYGGAEILWQAGGVYQATNVTVAPSNFELAQAGPGGPATAQVASLLGLLFDVGLAAPARPGQTIFLAGSGLGNGTQVAAMVGGIPATVTYAGRDGRRPGYDQIQLRLPAGITDSCFAPLSLTIGSVIVNSSVSVTSDGAPCPHPFQLSVADLKTLDGGGSIAAGQISLRSDLQAALDTAASRTETAGFTVAAWNLTSFQPFGQAALQGCMDITPPAAWVDVPVFRSGDFVGSLPGPAPPLPYPGKPLVLQNGTTALTLPDSNGNYSVTVTPAPEASLANLLPSVLMPGKWSLSSPGSADLAASSFSFSLPAPLRLAAGAPVSLRRDQDQTIGWNGADFGFPATVNFILTGRGPDGSTPRTVSCSAPASAGSIVIPAAFLAPFASPSLGSLRAQFSPAFESLPHTLLKTKKGDTLLLYVPYSSSDSRPVDFR